MAKKKQALFIGFISMPTLILLYPGQAYAYIDPASGSLLLQLMIASIGGLVIVIKVYWKKFNSFFKGKATQDISERENE